MIALTCSRCGRVGTFDESERVDGRRLTDWWDVVAGKRCKACRVPLETEKLIGGAYVMMGTGFAGFSDHAVYRDLVDHVASRKREYHHVVLVSGAQRGWDSAIARCGYDLGVPVIQCVPNKGFGAYYWSDRMEAFQFMLSCAAQVEYTQEDWARGDVDKKYNMTYAGDTVHVNVWRNRRMIQLTEIARRHYQGGEVLAYWKPGCRGTTRCLDDLRRLAPLSVVHFGDAY